MSLTMFIVGFVIFSAYLYFLIWNIFWSSKKQREENYPGINGMGRIVDDIDMDGMGNFSRFPESKVDIKIKKVRSTKRSKSMLKQK